ncbi:hypothetical protein B0J12DRAFT_695066 [Macrophomina phaseolina]|uniref:Uncharacterized protein n=1 Tax=Macrophomina phaseolina TaxID=35725 RepID=A0ABQ8GQT3_9PEZI|nr:hypothetical protein B0J12DRAFT_695066 [Macrophomina phaseolina]
MPRIGIIAPAPEAFGFHGSNDSATNVTDSLSPHRRICVPGVCRLCYNAMVVFPSSDVYWTSVWNYNLLAIQTHLGLTFGCLPCWWLIFRNINYAIRTCTARGTAREMEDGADEQQLCG